MVRAAAAAGTRTIVATPHVDLRYGVTPADVAQAVAALNGALVRDGVGATVLAGAEIALERLIDLSERELDALTLAGHGSLLVEAPLRDLRGDFEWPIRALLERGRHRVVIAHPERCPAFLAAPGRLTLLREKGALCQVTVSALTGDFGAETRAYALTLALDGAFENLSSDMHDPEVRGPSLRRGLAVLADHGVPVAVGRWLTHDVPCALVSGSAIPERPPGQGPTTQASEGVADRPDQ